MNGLQQLINQLCPNGVEWKTLGEVCEMQRGTSLTKANSIEGEYPVISGGKEPAFYCNQYNREGETITIAGSGAGAGFVQYWNQKIFVNDAFSMKGSDNLSVRYLYYCLQNLQEQIYATKKGGGVPHVHISDVKGFQIPLPPLAIQSRIVEILDHFTNLTANLTAELALRRKQFEHFREKLLSLDGVEKGEMKKLGEVCKLERGRRVVKSELAESGLIPVFQNCLQPLGYYDKSNRDAFTAFVICAGAAGEIGYSNVPFWCADDCFTVSHEKNVDSKYIFYFLQTKQTFIKSKVRKAGVPRLDHKVVEGIIISVPPLAVQQSIVAKLDKFTALIQNIENELALRQKQYEYYREKLLSFPSPSL